MIATVRKWAVNILITTFTTSVSLMLQEKSCRLFAFTHGVSRRLRQGSGKWQKAAKTPLWSPFVKKTSQNFWRELKKWSAFFYLPPPFWTAFWGRNFRISLWNDFLKITSLLQRKTQNTQQLLAVSVVHNTWLSRNLVAFLTKFRLCAWFFPYDDVYLF